MSSKTIDRLIMMARRLETNAALEYVQYGRESKYLDKPMRLLPVKLSVKDIAIKINNECELISNEDDRQEFLSAINDFIERRTDERK